MNNIECPFARDEQAICNLIFWAKEDFDHVYLYSVHPAYKHQLLPKWYLWQKRTIQPLVDELHKIAKWREEAAKQELERLRQEARLKTIFYYD